VEHVRQWTRAVMSRTARDATRAVQARSALVVAPHPDDETLGCGATIARKVAAGAAVTVLVLTDGRHSHRSAHVSPDDLAALRRKEFAEATRRLGLGEAEVIWGGLTDGSLAAEQEQVSSVMAEALHRVRPDELYATCADEPHPDHAAVGRAARRVASTAGTPVQLLEYPIWLWNAWPMRRGDRAGSTVAALRQIALRQAVTVAAGPYAGAKRDAIEAYASQLRRPAGIPDSEEWAGLPPTVLRAAASAVELFLPWRR
jgi:LmbE family N-acetylglucosaminyl deacetylase